MKDKLKYILILGIACLSFILIDNVYAISNTSRVSMHLTGESKVSFYQNGSISVGPSSMSTTSMFGTSYSYFSTDLQTSYGYQLATFLQWTVPVEIVKGYDKVSFTVGARSGYFNNATFTTGNGWIGCQALSIPPSDLQVTGGFTSFTCDIDQTSVPDTGNVTLYLTTYLTQLGDALERPNNVQPYYFYYQNDVIFYSSESTQIENEIKDNTDAINEQTEATKDQTNTIKDSNVNTDSSNSFFGGFNTEDNGGLSAVVTAPLSFIQKATQTCSPLTLRMFDKDIEIPCGDTLFWGRPEVSEFRTLWNVLVGGAALFLVLRKVFKTVENIKDPQNDKVEVMKL